MRSLSMTEKSLIHDDDLFRLHGFYEADQGLVQHQEQKLLDYRNLLNRASARFTHTHTRHHYS